MTLFACSFVWSGLRRALGGIKAADMYVVLFVAGGCCSQGRNGQERAMYDGKLKQNNRAAGHVRNEKADVRYCKV